MPNAPKKTADPFERIRFCEEYRERGREWSHVPKETWQNYKSPKDNIQSLLEALDAQSAEASNIEDHELRLRRLEEQVERHSRFLLQFREDEPVVPLGEFERWRASKEAAKWAGQHVAFLPGKGEIIASDQSLGKLLKQLADIDPDSHSVVGLVPG